MQNASMVLIAAWALAGCAGLGADAGKEQTMTYRVKRLGGPMTVDANWDKAAWRTAEPLELTHFMGKRPEHFPKVRARIAYDHESLYVIFRVDDRYIRAVARRHQDSVCTDSCVEFFFAPGPDVSKGYMNLEMNCGGTMLFHYQLVPRKDQVPVSPADLASILVAHTLPKRIEVEITEPTTWTVEYRIPFEILGRYYPDPIMPAPGVRWRANLFKCADATSRPHWLTWAPVDKPSPDFHTPEFFGVLEFE